MTIGDMEVRLREEFPDKYVSFSVDVNKYSSNRAVTTIQIYEPNVGFIEAQDFETCVCLLKAKLYPPPAGKTFNVEFA